MIVNKNHTIPNTYMYIDIAPFNFIISFINLPKFVAQTRLLHVWKQQVFSQFDIQVEPTRRVAVY